MPDGNDFLCVREDGTLARAAWLDPYGQKKLLDIPNDTRRVAADSQFESVVVQTPVAVLGAKLDGEDKRLFAMLSQSFDTTALAVHPTKKLYAMGIRSGTVLVKEDGMVVTIFGSPQPVDRVAFDPTGNYLAVLSAQTIEVWSIHEWMVK